MRISVIGGSSVDEETYAVAVELGEALGHQGHDVICGGLTGVMEGVSEGMVETSGRAIGILPGENPERANPYVDIPIATGLGNARNVIVVLSGEAVIAIDGGTGTLSEIAHALDFDRPVAGIETHDIPGVHPVGSPDAAIDYVERKTR